ncbi:MAG: N-acetylmuramoyl-L-alanine amidase [Opitutaceae bacterium]|nr:N-acetylmuramoyl-L-alanine amidase [Opitutaceae bacterium]
MSLRRLLSSSRGQFALLLSLAWGTIAPFAVAQDNRAPSDPPDGFVALAPVMRGWGIKAQRMSVEGAQTFANAWNTLEMQHDSREFYFNGLRIFMGEGAVAHGGELWASRIDVQKLLRPLLRPQEFAQEAQPVRRIMIDAGHGGKDRGTFSDPLALSEKQVALDVALRLEAILTQQGFEVEQIRTDDVFVEKGQRALMAQLAKADLFVSIHFNAAGNPNARGTETYVLTPARQRSTGDASTPIAELGTESGNATDAWNVVLGAEVHRALINRMGTVDRGLKRARFAVLRLAKMPAILIEAGFLSHEEEAREIASPSRRGEIAEAMANGIVAYANQVQAFQSTP